jgi:hypothetical protein
VARPSATRDHQPLSFSCSDPPGTTSRPKSTPPARSPIAHRHTADAISGPIRAVDARDALADARNDQRMRALPIPILVRCLHNGKLPAMEAIHATAEPAIPRCPGRRACTGIAESEQPEAGASPDQSWRLRLLQGGARFTVVKPDLIGMGDGMALEAEWAEDAEIRVRVEERC